MVRMHLSHVFLCHHVRGRDDHHRNVGDVDDDDPPLLGHGPSQSRRMMFPCHNMEEHENFDDVRCITVRMSASKVVGDDDHDLSGHRDFKTTGIVLPCHHTNKQ